MKKTILIATIPILCAIFLSFKNQNIVSKSINDPFILPVNQAVLYVGIDNPVYIYVKGVNPKDLIINIKGGTLTNKTNGKINNYTHFVKPNRGSDTVEISVFHKRKKNKEIYSQIFKVKYIPNPIFNIANMSQGSGSISKDMFVKYVKENPEIKGEMGCLTFEDYYTIKSFSMVLGYPTKTREFIEAESGESRLEFVYGGEIRDYRTNSNKLSPEMITALENAPTGTKVFFEKIVLEGVKDGQEHKANAMVFILH